MPILKRDDAEIYFEEFGNGYPLLLFAPGGMRSRIEMWHAPKDGPPRPWNDWTDELASRYPLSPPSAPRRASAESAPAGPPSRRSPAR